MLSKNPKLAKLQGLIWENMTSAQRREYEILNAIEYRGENLQKQAQKWTRVKQVARKLAKKEFPEGCRFHLDEYGIYIYFPWGVENLRKVRLLIGNEFKYTGKDQRSDGSIQRNYKLTYGEHWMDCISISLVMDAANLPEGTCKKVLISSEVKTYTQEKYIVVCS